MRARQHSNAGGGGGGERRRSERRHPGLIRSLCSAAEARAPAVKSGEPAGSRRPLQGRPHLHLGLQGRQLRLHALGHGCLRQEGRAAAGQGRPNSGGRRHWWSAPTCLAAWICCLDTPVMAMGWQEVSRIRQVGSTGSRREKYGGAAQQAVQRPHGAVSPAALPAGSQFIVVE